MFSTIILENELEGRERKAPTAPQFHEVRLKEKQLLSLIAELGIMSLQRQHLQKYTTAACLRAAGLSQRDVPHHSGNKVLKKPHQNP